MQNLLKDQNIEAILVTKPENIRYHTGFIGSFGQVILTGKKKYLFTDARYTLQAKKLCDNKTSIVIIKDYQEDLNKILAKHKINNIGFEDSHLTVSQFKAIKKYFKGPKLKPIGLALDHYRIIKTEQEIKLIRKSQKINEDTLAKVIRNLKVGQTEAEIAWKLVSTGRSMGAEDVSFDPIVAFGKNSASPHYTPANRKYKKGDVALIDMGFKYQGYCSDMTRTFLPKAATTQMLNVYNTVLEAQRNCINNLQPGMKGSKGDKLSRELINKNGFKENFPHANGHGVGLEIHEAPSLSFKAKHKDKSMTIQENMVITVEPGIYLENKFGIRIEDMIVVKSGRNKNLTRYPKDLKSILI
jgi:Xaa-Pro aminopeptidase